MDEHDSLFIFVVVIPLTALALGILLGTAFFVFWLLTAGLELLWRSFNPSHPITTQEEID